MEEYEQICLLAEKTGFKDFTPLQWKIFSDDNFFDCTKWLFVTGATGSGKTLVPLMFYFFERERRALRNLTYKMLFVVPYRALAAQKTDEIKKFTTALNLNLNIFQSTSEYLANDADIFSGKADIAVIINEKVFMFACNDPAFLDKYDLLVFDEIGLIKNLQRGIKTDFVLLHARQKNHLRVIALGTPFYSWDNYIKKFGFLMFTEERRPIELLELPLIYDAEKICAVAEGCEAVKPKAFSESIFFGDTTDTTDKMHWLMLIAEVCAYHLQRNERILVFFNSRGDVRHFSRMLSRELVAKEILKPLMSVGDCKKYILEKIQADDVQILCGIMDNLDYYTFSCGIAYHNANMFSTLRAVIEEDFVSKDGVLNIVFSTETLAFGINSCADVVIIPDIEKYKFGARKRFLHPNEYMNYCGRAGRLDSSRSFADQKQFGYVYPFLKADEYQQAAWLNLQAQIQAPEKITSNFFEAGYTDSSRPLYVLSLFSLFENRTKGISALELEGILKALPGSGGVSLTDEVLKEALDRLAARNLIYKISDDDAEEEVDYFQASDVGRKLAGYVVALEDYDYMLNMVCEYVTKNNLFLTDMFYSVVSSVEVLTNAKNNACALNVADAKFFRAAVLRMKSLFTKFRNETTTIRHNLLMSNVNRFESLVIKNAFGKLNADKDFFVCRILAAVLMWFDSNNCSPIKLYDSFKIYYEPMHRMIELISYRLELLAAALPYAPSNKVGRVLFQTLTPEQLGNAAAKMSAIAERILFFPSQELCDFLGFKHCDLYKAQRLYNAERLYKLLTDSEGRTSHKALFAALVADMKNWHPAWREQFTKHFGGEIICPNR